MSADYSRIHRLLRILTLIQSEPGWTARRLAEVCGTSERTIYRDMRMLDAAGIPYYHDVERPGYRVRRDFFMPPVQLTLDESLALIALAEHIGGREQVPLTRAAARAVSKVRGLLPPAMREQLEKIEKHVAIQLARSGPCDGIRDVYQAVQTAITRRRALQCEYEAASRDGQSVQNGQNGQDGREADAPFRFRPYTLFFSKRAWYAVGMHDGRGEVRCLKLSRFTRIEPTREPYDIPESFRLDDHLGLAWRMIRGEKRYGVELWFDPEFAETIADTQWHATQQITWQDDGSIIFRCEVDGLDEIVWWVLSMGPHCRVHKPTELARRVADLAIGVVEHYGDSRESHAAG
jgi:predicted DNA-binding transcriptional regulator YafY